ncbi:MAG: DNA translocase FtsK 4TM domain-containing protein, partial [Planctomycetota bacterium]
MEMRHPLDRRREIVAVGIGALSLFILAATLTFVPNGYRSDGGGNLCGPVGNLLGGGLLFLFGYPAYLIHLGLAIFSVLLWRDRLPEEMPLRLLGLVGCVVSFAATLGLWIDAESFASMAMPGPGGMVGDYLSWRSEQLFGELGSSILLIGLSAIFTILAAGGLVVAAAERAWEGAQSLAEWMRSPDLFRRPAKKPAKQKPRPKKVKKTEKSKKAKTESEELEEILADQVGPEPEPDEWIEEEPEEEEIGAEVAEEDTAAEEDEEEVEEEHEPAGPLYDDLEEEDAEPDLEEDDEEIEEAKPSKLRSLLKSKKKQGSGEAMPSSTTFESADYTPPALDLLQQEESNEDTRRMDAMIQRKGEILESALRNFKIDARVVNVDRGPVIAMYEIELAAGIKLNRITSLADDLAMALKAPNVRIVA